MAPPAACLVLQIVMHLLAAALAATAQQAAPSSVVVYRVLTHTQLQQRRNQQLTCPDPKTKLPGCVTQCEARCPNQCIVVCPGCKTYCICDLYPGMSCGDPRFTGGDGNTFYFHGSKDQDFCIFTDAGLHINAHFIGRRDPAMSRDFTWIQALGIRFAHHRLYVGAARTATWSDDVDRLDIAFDGERVAVPPQAAWRPADVPGLTVARTAAANGVRVRLQGAFDIMANVVPIGQEESRIHNYGVTDGDVLAHLDLGFRFLDLTDDDVHGVLGQTYRSDYVNHLSVSSSMPVMGGAPNYVSSDIDLRHRLRRLKVRRPPCHHCLLYDLSYQLT